MPQLSINTFFSLCTAGVFCAIVSHPADTVVSKLNQEKGSTAVGVAKKLGFAGKLEPYGIFAPSDFLITSVVLFLQHTLIKFEVVPYPL